MTTLGWFKSMLLRSAYSIRIIIWYFFCILFYYTKCIWSYLPSWYYCYILSRI